MYMMRGNIKYIDIHKYVPGMQYHILPPKKKLFNISIIQSMDMISINFSWTKKTLLINKYNM